MKLEVRSPMYSGWLIFKILRSLHTVWHFLKNIYRDANILDRLELTMFNMWNSWYGTWARDNTMKFKLKQIKNSN